MSKSNTQKDQSSKTSKPKAPKLLKELITDPSRNLLLEKYPEFKKELEIHEKQEREQVKSWAVKSVTT